MTTAQAQLQLDAFWSAQRGVRQPGLASATATPTMSGFLAKLAEGALCPLFFAVRRGFGAAGGSSR